jgi:Flp pilus assembly pilin Flp
MRAQPRTRRGQATAEYALLLGIVAAAVVGIHYYAKRGIQAGVKFATDSLVPGGVANAEPSQLAGMQYESGDRTDKSLAEGTVIDRRSAMRSIADKSLQHQIDTGGRVTRTILRDQTDAAGALDDRGTSSSSAVIVNIQ